MPYFNLLITLMVCFVLSFSVYAKVTVSSYDVNSAIKSRGSDSAKNSNVIATSENNRLDVLGFWFVNSGLSYSDDVVVTRVAFNNFLFDSSDGTINVEDINMNTDTVAEIMGEPLFYPNPFRFSNVNTQTGSVGARLYYKLSQEMDIEIQMYDIFGHKILTKEFPSGTPGGRAGENEILFNKEE